MEFNAGIFSFTGTRKNPLNIFRPRLLTMWAPLAPWAAGVAFVIYQYYQWLDAVNLSARRSFLESWPQARPTQSQAQAGNRDGAFRNVHTKSRLASKPGPEPAAKDAEARESSSRTLSRLVFSASGRGP